MVRRVSAAEERLDEEEAVEDVEDVDGVRESDEERGVVPLERAGGAAVDRVAAVGAGEGEGRVVR